MIKRLFVHFIFTLFIANISLANEKNIVIIHDEPINIPEISFFDDQDKLVTLEQFDSKIIVLNIWATWCAVCASKMPDLDKLAKKLKKEDITIVPISLDYRGYEVVKSFYESKNIKNLGIFLDKKRTLLNALSLPSIPAVIFVNKSGQEFARIYGIVDWEQDKKIMNIINQYIELHEHDDEDQESAE